MNKTDHNCKSACNCNLAKASPLRTGRCYTRENSFLCRDPVLGIRIRRIHMFLGLPDPNPLVRGTDPDEDPHQNATDPQHWRDPTAEFPILCTLEKLRHRHLLGINHYLFQLLIKGKWYLQDSVHTLTCAIMLLNTDLHNDALQQQQRRMSAQVRSWLSNVCIVQFFGII